MRHATSWERKRKRPRGYDEERRTADREWKPRMKKKLSKGVRGKGTRDWGESRYLEEGKWMRRMRQRAACVCEWELSEDCTTATRPCFIYLIAPSSPLFSPTLSSHEGWSVHDADQPLTPPASFLYFHELQLTDRDRINERKEHSPGKTIACTRPTNEQDSLDFYRFLSTS